MSFLSEADAQLRRMKQVLGELGLQCVELSPVATGTGFGVAFGETDYVVVAVAGGGSEGNAYITSGVFRDINDDRLAALEACNERVSSNPACPFFLHDADAGWDILLQLSYPVQLLLDLPHFFGALLRGTPQEVERARPDFATKGVYGTPYRWCEEDAQRLLMRSLV